MLVHFPTSMWNNADRNRIRSLFELQSSQMNLFLFLLLLRSICVQGFPEQVEKSKLSGRLEHVLQMIFSNTCAANKMSIFISTDYREHLTKAEERLVDYLLDELLPCHNLEDQVPVLLDQKLRSPLNLQVHFIVFFVQSKDQFLSSVGGNSGATATHKHKFLVVLFSESLEQVSQIFGYMLHVRMNIDVLVLLAQPKAQSVRIYTFYPYGTAAQPNCESFVPVELPLRQALLSQLYPQKLDNLNGCPLSAIVWHIPPYIELSKAERTVAVGWDAQLFGLMARKLNFGINWIENEPPDLIGGEVQMNGSSTGAFRMLQDRRGNLTFGCTACNSARAMYFSNTVSYNQVDYIIVFREGMPYSYYEIMMFPYQCCTWILLLILAVMRLLFGIFGTCIVPSPFRLGLIMLLFVLRIGYEGSIFKFVHNAPVRPLPHSWDQALLENYSLIMDHATHRMISDIPALRDHARVLPGKAVDLFDQLPSESRIGLFTSRDFFSYYLSQQWTVGGEHRQRFVILDHKMMNNILCMHLPLGSYLANTISQMLFDLRSFGICQQLNKFPSWSFPSLTTSNSNQIQSISNSSINPFEESMRFLHAAFSCLLIAESLILGVFFLELLSSRRGFLWFRRLLQRL